MPHIISLVNEKTSRGRSGHFTAQGTLAQPLTTMAVSAHHVATGNEGNRWTVLVADGTRRTSATGDVRLLLSQRIWIPTGRQLKHHMSLMEGVTDTQG